MKTIKKLKRARRPSNTSSDTAFFDSPGRQMRTGNGTNPFNGPEPPHLRKFTAHSYFSSTLRSAAANDDPVVVIIPQMSTELELRKQMFRIYKEEGLRNPKDYENRLKELVQQETTYIDIKMSGMISKRYLFRKSEVESGTVNMMANIPLDNSQVQHIRRATVASVGK